MQKEQKIQKKFEIKNEGITLIALIITIIVLLILAGVVLATLSGDSGPITKAQEATIMSELSRYKEKLELYKIEKYSENLEFEEETLTAGKNVLVYNTQKQEEVGKENITAIIPDISDTYLEKIEVIKGELLINTPIEEEIVVAKNLGIRINPYDIRDGVLWSSNGNLALLGEETGSITIPDSVTAIGEGAFANVEGLKTVVIPSTVKRIEQNAFNGNQTLEEVIMQEKINADGTIEGVEYIGTAAFANCPNLTTVQMSNSVKEVGGQVFYLDRKLENVNISKNLRIINRSMFSSCINLKNIEIPEGIISINGYAFADCTNLNKIKIPGTIESIDGTAFNNCRSLTNIEIAEENDSFEFKNNILLAKLEENKTEIVIILESAINDNTLIIPDTVINLKSGQLGAFNNIITKVEIPASVENIEGYFFNNNITNVVINSENQKYEVIDNAIYTKESYGEDIEIVRYFGNDSNVKIKDKTKVIKSNCFSYKSNITNLELPDSIERIETQALTRCYNLKSIRLGANVSSFDNMSIYGAGIEKIEIDENNQNYRIVKDGGICDGNKVEALYNKAGNIFISPIKPNDIIKTYEIPEEITIGTEKVTVTEIATYAFHNQAVMTDIKLPNKIEKIGGAFNYCNGLTKIEIPNSIKEIGTGCFSNCPNLIKIRVHKKRGEVAGDPWGCIYGDKAIIWDE